MFGRWRKQKEEGMECPLCGMISPEGTPECPRCYYQLEKGILEQDEQDVTEQADGLFDELNSEDAEEEEEELVDWTSHSFGVDEVTIDVSQYDDSESVNIDAAPGFASYGKAQPELADHPWIPQGISSKCSLILGWFSQDYLKLLCRLLNSMTSTRLS